jgi:uncharacterized protein (DUF2141 family)
MHKKSILIIFLALCSLLNVYGININLEVSGVRINNGKIYVSIYSNEAAYKAKNPFMKFTLEPDSTLMNYNLELSDGEYVVSVFQDINSNGKLDTNFVGMPKEPVGIANYEGKGMPGGFQKLKVTVNAVTTKITVNIRNI